MGINEKMREITFIDLFAGGGGTSTGAYAVPGIKVVAAVNHDDIAIKTHAANHPETLHFREDLWVLDEKRLPKCDVMWASLECTDHSKAKGGKEKNIGSFALGHCLTRYLKWCEPDVLWIENVPEFVRWGELTKEGKRIKDKEGLEYLAWVKSIKDLGYVHYDRRFLNAADFGCPTRRVRYFGMFCKAGYKLSWPRTTHAEKENIFGLPTWVPCKNYIDLSVEGESIFGRSVNEKVKPGKRHQLSSNTLKRIAGGIKKFAPEVYFIMQYYGNGDNCQSVDKPLNTVRTHESQTLIKIEKSQFIQDHCHTSSYNLPDEPLKPQLTRQTKQLITVEKKFLSKYYSSEPGREQHHCQDVDQPFPTIKTVDGTTLVTAKAQFYTRALTNDYANQPLEKPAPTITTFGSDAIVTAKARFVSSTYNSNGKPEANNHSIESPLAAITTREKHQFITTYFNLSNTQGLINSEVIDFDIKMRFLTDEELASIMGFPVGYFKKPGLKLSKKQIIKMVGNAVPVGMARALISATIPVFDHEYESIAV